ncbi:exonuclease V isoform X2 [Brachyhypopomus gauderio]|uniref:exonuclease V isoform X2 n=1 Tax=Brachyhypopomus gauderio TaxID=698409 RepID=UPI004041D060
MEKVCEDWDGISDSEFLDIPLDHFYLDENEKNHVKCSSHEMKNQICSPQMNLFMFLHTETKSKVDSVHHEPHQSVRSQKDVRGDASNNNQVTLQESFHRTGERSEPSTVQMDEERGLKRKSDPEGGCGHQLRFRKNHLSVTMLCEQAWCEMKLQYDLEKPHVRRREKKRPEVQTGADIHLARELEIQEVVRVDIRSKEDVMAVTLLKMLCLIPLLETGVCVREFPVFGVLEGVHLKGVIDELSYNQKGALVLKELKTRRDDCLPGDAQTACHNLQVGLYKVLFDAMVRGEVKREHIVDHLHLRDSRRLGDGVLAHAASAGLCVATFGELADAFLQTLSSSVLPCIDLLQVEYQHQGSAGLIGTREASFDHEKLRAELRHYLAYWSGRRESRGVEIEEAWKCNFCPHREVCVWRSSGYQPPDTPHISKRVK